MKCKLVGIAGGSGAGKSTVCYSLVDQYPQTFEVINLDDYQKLRDDPSLPQMAGMTNWDHPDVVRWQDLIRDLKNLKSGAVNNIMIESWAHRSNPDYFKHYKLKPRTIQARPIILVEGYLALHNPDLNKLYDKTFYLDLAQETRHWRRDKGAVLAKDTYLTQVLEPMHQQYVEPTKQLADIVIDVTAMSKDEISSYIYKELSSLIS